MISIIATKICGELSSDSAEAGMYKIICNEVSDIANGEWLRLPLWRWWWLYLGLAPMLIPDVLEQRMRCLSWHYTCLQVPNPVPAGWSPGESWQVSSVLVWVKEDVCSEHPVVRIGCWLGTSVYTNRLERWSIICENMINLFLCSLVVAQPRESMNTTTPKINSTVFVFFNNPFTSASLFTFQDRQCGNSGRKAVCNNRADQRVLHSVCKSCRPVTSGQCFSRHSV